MLTHANRPAIHLPSGWRAEPTNFNGGYKAFSPDGVFAGYLWPAQDGGGWHWQSWGDTRQHTAAVFEPSQALAAMELAQ
jgi:hypothetical protein